MPAMEMITIYKPEYTGILLALIAILFPLLFSVGTKRRKRKQNEAIDAEPIIGGAPPNLAIVWGQSAPYLLLLGSIESKVGQTSLVLTLFVTSALVALGEFVDEYCNLDIALPADASALSTLGSSVLASASLIGTAAKVIAVIGFVAAISLYHVSDTLMKASLLPNFPL